MIRRSQPAAFVLIMCGFLLKNPILITFVAFSLLPFASAKLEMAEEYPVLDDFGRGYETGYSGCLIHFAP